MATAKCYCLLVVILVVVWFSELTAAPYNQVDSSTISDASFADDLAFLRKHTQILVLSDDAGKAQVAIAPEWQGRVMTSTAVYGAGRSFGWINRRLIASGKIEEHINAFGGEDRFWLGPEGGQFSIFFSKGAPFSIDHWFVPRELDTYPFKTIAQSRTHASFQSEFALTNYSGTRFKVGVRRDVRLLDSDFAWKCLGVTRGTGVSVVGYESKNVLTNAGGESWRKETGLLSIWILGMFKPSPSATIVVPIKAGPDALLGPRVTSDYFGVVPPERLVVTNEAIFFRGDGKFRSKIGISARRSLATLGSYDSESAVLTIVQFSQPDGAADYVNSLWKYQEDPYAGDTANSYNDGPAAEGGQALGPFFELESSSPAAALRPGGSIEHTHRTLHLTGPDAKLDEVSRAVLRVSLKEIRGSLDSSNRSINERPLR